MKRECAAGFLCSVALLSACEMPARTVVAESSSPKGTYRVRLTGRSTSPKAPGFEHRVRAQVLGGQDVLVSSHLIHSGDWFDRGFAEDYVGHEWVSENVLRFIGYAEVKGDGSDEIVVENHSGRSIRLLRIGSTDMFLCIALPPKPTLHLRATAQAPETDNPYVMANGIWEDGSAMPEAGVNFRLPTSPRNPDARQRYAIVIRSDSIEISQR